MDVDGCEEDSPGELVINIDRRHARIVAISRVEHQVADLLDPSGNGIEILVGAFLRHFGTDKNQDRGVFSPDTEPALLDRFTPIGGGHYVDIDATGSDGFGGKESINNDHLVVKGMKPFGQVFGGRFGVVGDFGHLYYFNELAMDADGETFGVGVFVWGLIFQIENFIDEG